MGGYGIEVIGMRDKVEGHQQEDPEIPMNPANVQGYGMAQADGGAGGAVRSTSRTVTAIPPLKVRVQRSSSANDRSTDDTTDELDMLKTENAFLRLALKEANEKLRNAENINDGAGEKVAGAVRPVRREPGNGGVAYARMRRLLLKDTRFFSEGFLAYLNIEDLGRCSAVCRRFKKAIYEPDIVIRCVESGGLTDRLRGLMWLIMVSMEPMGVSTSGLLSVVARNYPESPEKQYDRLHRAMNGTLASPVNPSRTNAGEDDMSGDASANDKTPRSATPERRGRKKLDGEVGDGGRLSVLVSDNSDSALDVEGEGNGRDVADSGASVEGGASLGNGCVLSLDDSSTVSGISKTRDNDTVTAMAKAAVEAADAAYAAEAAAGIRPLGRSSVVGAGVDKEDDDGEEEHRSSASEGFGLTAEATEKAWTRGNGGEASALAGGTDSAPPSVGTSTTSVVGWASGLFRKSPSMMSVTTRESFANSPTRAGKGSLSLTPETSRHNRRESSLSLEATSPTSRAGRGLLFGLRYGASRPKSELPANSSPSVSTTSFSSFFGDIGGKQKHQQQHQGSGGKSSASDRASTKGENEDVDNGWPAVQRVPGLYAALLNSADAMDANDITGVRGPKQSCFVDIEKDLKRTLGMKDVSPLRNVLRCMSTFVPDVGYVQGMNFVCRSLLQVFDDEEEVFWVFVGMLQRFGLRKLYSPGMPLLRLRFFQLNRLLMWHLPELFEHFESCGVHTNLFATSWFVTLLSDGGMLPDREVKFVWDRIFLHATSPSSQWSPIFLFLLEMLRRASGALKKESRFSELIHRLVNMPFRELCEGRGASSMITEAGRRFETSSPMPVQLLLLHDQWEEGRGEEGLAEGGDEKQLL